MKYQSDKLSCNKKPSAEKNPYSTVLRKSFFDTKNYYYYFTEVKKERYSR